VVPRREPDRLHGTDSEQFAADRHLYPLGRRQRAARSARDRGRLRPVFAPDGRTIAFSRTHQAQKAGGDGAGIRGYKSTTAWLVDLATGDPRRITRWRNGLEYFPTSFSPDGSILALVRSRNRRVEPEVLAMHLDRGGISVLARRASDAVYSPDGSRLALLRIHTRAHVHDAVGESAEVGVEATTDLFVMNADGSGSRRLTDTPTKFELWPTWDPSGQRLAYTQFGGGSEADFLGLSDALMEINADGSCPTRVLSYPHVALYGAAWQPGPGREAGPIACAGR
jgi:Tol biopolymer transport system component